MDGTAHPTLQTEEAKEMKGKLEKYDLIWATCLTVGFRKVIQFTHTPAIPSQRMVHVGLRLKLESLS